MREYVSCSSVVRGGRKREDECAVQDYIVIAMFRPRTTFLPPAPFSIIHPFLSRRLCGLRSGGPITLELVLLEDVLEAKVGEELALLLRGEFLVELLFVECLRLLVREGGHRG